MLNYSGPHPAHGANRQLCDRMMRVGESSSEGWNHFFCDRPQLFQGKHRGYPGNSISIIEFCNQQRREFALQRVIKVRQIFQRNFVVLRF